MKWKFGLILATILFFAGVMMPVETNAAGTNYTVTPSTKPMDAKMLKFSTYNSYTKHYYLLRSYLEQLEKKGGGTLTLKKGTYTITNTLYVPSNVSIRFQNGVKLVKGTETGTSKFIAAKSMFQLIRPSRSGKKNVYGGYNGEKNISFIGEGTVTIDMNYDKDSIAIIAGHNQNVKVENIQFRKMYSGHFIEMDASKNVTIKKNKFIDSKASANQNKEAINLDTPDKATLGWSQVWSKYDKMPNQNVVIEGNEFKNLDRAVGTHKYSQGKYHDKVVIRSNYIEKTRQDAIRAMNWSNAIIEKNTIKDVAGKSGTYRGILASGVKNPTFQNNKIEKASRPIQIMPWKNSGPGSQYAVTENSISQKNIEALSTNKVSNTNETFIRINTVYNNFDPPTTIKVQLQ